MRINWLWRGLWATLLFPALAQAADLQPPSRATVADLSQIQSETIMYDAKAKRAESKGKMQENQAKAGDDPQLSQPSTAPPVFAAELPTITGISGAAGRLFATFQYPNGTMISSKSGEQIPGGFHVSEIGIDRVVLTKGDRRIPLQFGVANTPVPAQSTSGRSILPGSFSPPAPLR